MCCCHLCVEQNGRFTPFRIRRCQMRSVADSSSSSPSSNTGSQGKAVIFKERQWKGSERSKNKGSRKTVERSGRPRNGSRSTARKLAFPWRAAVSWKKGSVFEQESLPSLGVLRVFEQESLPSLGVLRVFEQESLPSLGVLRVFEQESLTSLGVLLSPPAVPWTHCDAIRPVMEADCPAARRGPVAQNFCHSDRSAQRSTWACVEKSPRPIQGKDSSSVTCVVGPKGGVLEKKGTVLDEESLPFLDVLLSPACRADCIRTH